MRVHVVDPPAFTPPYDHALCGALTRAGAEVELVTSHFLYGPVPTGEGYTVNEAFYPGSARRGKDASSRDPGRRSRSRHRLDRAYKLREHIRDMRAYKPHAQEADVVHWQWLPVPQIDRLLIAPKRPRVFTLHHFLPASPTTRQAKDIRARLESFDAVVMHSEAGKARVEGEFGVREGLVEVIPHGAFDYLTRQAEERPLPPELAAVEGPVILAYGLIRPYKGTDILLEAFQRVEGAELWIAGMPHIDMAPLHRLAEAAPGRVRFIERFIDDAEVPALMRRADLVVQPYRTVEQSGVLYTGLAFGKAMVLSNVGGFPEVAAHGAARLVEPGDVDGLAATLNDLVADPAARRQLAAASAEAAATHYSWDEIGRRTLDLYKRVLAFR